MHDKCLTGQSTTSCYYYYSNVGRGEAKAGGKTLTRKSPLPKSFCIFTLIYTRLALLSLCLKKVQWQKHKFSQWGLLGWQRFKRTRFKIPLGLRISSQIKAGHSRWPPVPTPPVQIELVPKMPPNTCSSLFKWSSRSPGKGWPQNPRHSRHASRMPSLAGKGRNAHMVCGSWWVATLISLLYT